MLNPVQMSAYVAFVSFANLGKDFPALTTRDYYYREENKNSSKETASSLETTPLQKRVLEACASPETRCNTALVYIYAHNLAGILMNTSVTGTQMVDDISRKIYTADYLTEMGYRSLIQYQTILTDYKHLPMVGSRKNLEHTLSTITTLFTQTDNVLTQQEEVLLLDAAITVDAIKASSPPSLLVPPIAPGR